MLQAMRARSSLSTRQSASMWACFAVMCAWWCLRQPPLPVLALAHAIVWSKILVPHLGAVMTRGLQIICLVSVGAPCQDGSMELARTREELVRVLRARRMKGLGMDKAAERGGTALASEAQSRGVCHP